MTSPEAMDQIMEVREKLRKTEETVAKWKKENPGKELPAFYARELSYYERQINNLKEY